MAAARSSLLETKEEASPDLIRIESKLHRLTNIQEQLPIFFTAYQFRMLLCGLPANLKAAAIQRWKGENLEIFKKQIAALARPKVRAEEKNTIAMHLLDALCEMLNAITDDVISNQLEKTLRHYCAKHQYEGCALRIKEYKKESKELWDRYGFRYEKNALDYWEKKKNYLDQNISWKSTLWIGFTNIFLMVAGSALLIGFFWCLSLLYDYSDTRIHRDTEERRDSISLYMLGLTFVTVVCGMMLWKFILSCICADPSKIVPKVQADAKVMEQSFMQGVMAYMMDASQRSPLQSFYTALLNWLPREWTTSTFSEEPLPKYNKRRHNTDDTSSSSSSTDEPSAPEAKETLPVRPGEVFISGKDFIKFDPLVVPDSYVTQRTAVTAAFAKGVGRAGGIKELTGGPYPYEIMTGGGARVFVTTVQVNVDRTHTFHCDYFSPTHLDPHNKRARKDVTIQWEASGKKISLSAGLGIFKRIKNQIQMEEKRLEKANRRVAV